jgi:hypothetical protein
MVDKMKKPDDVDTIVTSLQLMLNAIIPTERWVALVAVSEFVKEELQKLSDTKAGQ